MAFRQLEPAPGRYGALLLLLIVSYLLSAFLPIGRWVEGLQVVLFSVVGLLALRSSTVPRRAVRVLLIGAIISVPIFFAISFSKATGEVGSGIANVWSGLILLGAAALIVRRVLAFGTVTLQSIFGAISAYLIVGLMFAAFFAAIYHFSGDMFFAHGEKASTQTFQYFSFTTLTTLGYGDYTAAYSGGQAVAVLEALTGQIFLATLVARLVAAYRGSGERQN
jgi:hypothetical protein